MRFTIIIAATLALAGCFETDIRFNINKLARGFIGYCNESKPIDVNVTNHDDNSSTLVINCTRKVNK